MWDQYGSQRICERWIANVLNKSPHVDGFQIKTNLWSGQTYNCFLSGLNTVMEEQSWNNWYSWFKNDLDD